MARVFLTCFFLPLHKAADLPRRNCAEDAEYFTCLENQQRNKITWEIGDVSLDKHPKETAPGISGFCLEAWCRRSLLQKDAQVKDMENIQDTHPLRILGLILQYQWGLTEVDSKEEILGILQSQEKSRYFKKIPSFLFPEMCRSEVRKVTEKKRALTVINHIWQKEEQWDGTWWDSQAFMYLLKFCIRRQGHDVQAF